MSDISKSRLGESLGADLERQISECTSAEQIKVLLADHAVKTVPGVTRDIYDPNVILVDENVVAPKAFAKAVIINGQKHVVEGRTEQELTQAETALYRAALGQLAADAEETRDDSSRFVPNLDNFNSQAEANLTERGLRENGIDPEALREYSDARQMQSWNEATSEFLNSEAGAWWPGGTANVQKIGEVLIEMGAMGSPSVENIRRADEYLRENNLLASNPILDQRDAIASSNSVEEIREALGRRDSSGMFGGR